ncbi:ABC transporter ATP-binding protein [Demequina sp. NBRC 110055]|uniref:ABC transporter ATP-binding protein n=1 Tax=Demequina sp. NBRC 110055 TaxID=1570344 RepID=UPI000A0275F5|nr:ATP-binding cassette domain-containing protein [Demequina sp. NBRC 110055]
MSIADGGEVVLALTDVTYRRGTTEILHGVSLQVRRGEHWAMLGPNGAGKSTILGFCGAEMHPTSGIVEVLGGRLGRVELQKLRRRIGHVDPRHRLASALTVTDVVLTGITGTIERPMRWSPSAADLDRTRDLIALLGLERHAEGRWPTLSQGERGRTLIARALIAEPELLLLDEPTTGLDVAAREQLLDTVDLLSTTHPDLASVLVTHHLEELPSTTSHALLLRDGAVVSAGPVDTVLTTELVTTCFDYPIEVEHRGGRWAARTRRGQHKQAGTRPTP